MVLRRGLTLTGSALCKCSRRHGGLLMPRKKKSPREMTKDELARKVFPRKAIREMERIAHERDKDGKQAAS